MLSNQQLRPSFLVAAKITSKASRGTSKGTVHLLDKADEPSPCFFPLLLFSRSTPGGGAYSVTNFSIFFLSADGFSVSIRVVFTLHLSFRCALFRKPLHHISYSVLLIRSSCPVGYSSTKYAEKPATLTTRFLCLSGCFCAFLSTSAEVKLNCICIPPILK